MRALVVEDEPKLASFIEKELKAHGFFVDTAGDGRKGEELARKNTYDIILLDWILHVRSGVDVCRSIRQEMPHVPILMLTALDGIEDQVKGLNAGADDYLTKPFDVSVLMARVSALLRRAKGMDTSGAVLLCGGLTMDRDARSVKRDGRPIQLTAREYGLLTYLLSRKGRVCTRMEILDHVWDQGFDPGTNVVEVYINMLRKKVDKPFGEPLIHTVTGMGYVMREPGE
jgi:two-component system copper resistance phosphate regulon response regulator CusR